MQNALTERLKQPWRWLRSWWWVLRNGYPARRLRVIGVTGTDGKTTTCWLIYEILKAAGKSVGMITTAGIKCRRANGEEESEENGLHVTNPDAKVTQGWLKKMADAGVEYAIIETTSHRLAQNKTVGYNVEVAVVTNLSREHLDYHGTMENYAAAKAKLVKRAPYVALNRDDEWYEYFRSQVADPERQKVIAFGKTRIPDGEISPRLAGEYNKYNIGAAEVVAGVVGVDKATVRRVVRSFAGVPGRREEVANKLGIRMVVDFAHTPRALEELLRSLKREAGRGSRLILVFGATGERDRGKRPEMGAVAAKYADVVVVTADDPRGEDLGEIYEQIVAGMADRQRRKAQGTLIREDDRDKAIAVAVRMAKRGDVVAATGMGPEPTILIKGREISRSDRAAFEAVAGR